MTSDGPEVSLTAAQVCWAAAGLWLDQGFRLAAILSKSAGEEVTVKQIIEDGSCASGHVLTPRESDDNAPAVFGV